MEQYKDAILAMIKLAEELAKKTDNMWDDQVAAICHSVFDRWFNIVHGYRTAKKQGTFAAGPSEVSSRFNLTAEEVNAVPAWLIKILTILAQLAPLFI